MRSRWEGQGNSLRTHLLEFGSIDSIHLRSGLSNSPSLAEEGGEQEGQQESMKPSVDWRTRKIEKGREGSWRRKGTVQERR